MSNEVKKEESNGQVPKLSGPDVMALLVCWAGVAAVSWFSKEPVVAVIAIAAAYYLAKWIILKKEK